MAPRGPRWVLCGGASHDAAPPDALRLHAGDAQGHALTIKISGLEDRLAAQLTPRFKDLIRIAAYVLAADCGTTRGSEDAVDLGATWRRDFRFVIPVLDLTFWSQPAVRRQLRELLRFLSDDAYDFHFVEGSEKAAMQLAFSGPEGEPFVSWGHIDEVMLFSGGMDSFAGAAEEVITRGRRVLLVSHRSSTKMHKVQRVLVDGLRERAPEGAAVWHIAVDVQRKAKPLRVESTQRSRSLLFAAIAGAVAEVVRRDHVRFYENGIIALNLPISKQLVGARATRTVHPKTLVGFEDLLTRVADRAITVDNPFQELTREDVARRINDAGAAELLRDTRSCARVWGATIMHPSCGVCSQCVDRQFAVRAAGLGYLDPDDMYRTAVFSQAIEDDDDAALGVAYATRAATFRRLTSTRGFVAEFGEVMDAVGPLSRLWKCSGDEVVERVMRLHQRQGDMVLRVLQDEMAKRAVDIVSGAIHPKSLLARCVKGGITEAERTYGVEEAPTLATTDQTDAVEAVDVSEALSVEVATRTEVLGRSTFRRNGTQWVIGCRGKPALLVRHRRGLALIAEVLRSHPDPVRAIDLDAIGRDVPVAASVPSIGAELDQKAIGDLARRAQRLRSNIQAASEIPDAVDQETERDRRELAFIEEQLSEATGPGRRPKEKNPELEAVRQRVKTNISQAIKELKKLDRPLGVHFQRHLALGVNVRWTGPSEPWDL